MLSRRDLLATGAAAALAGPGLARAAAAASGGEDARLASLFEALFQEQLDRSPEQVTALGLDKGARAGAKSRLDDTSLAGVAKDKAMVADWLVRLRAVDRSALSPTSAVDYDAVVYGLAINAEADKAFDFSSEGVGAPYVLSQLTGAYQSKPDFLGTQHLIETKADADAYLSRLEALGRVMDGETERARRDAGLGVVPPDFIIDRALGQMTGMKVAPGASPLVRSVADRARAKEIPGDYERQAAAIFTQKVIPALDRQIALLNSLRPRAVHDAGVWRLPQGEAYYALSLRQGTTSNLSPEEVHQIGLDQAKELTARAEVLLRGLGMTQGPVAARIQALYADKSQQYPNTDAGKETLIADLNALVAATMKRLPEYFSTLPKAPVEIRRVPKFTEAGAPRGYYNMASLDGSRPAIYWINLRDTAETPRWTLPTLTYHEAVPGHHLQLAIQQQMDLPMLRRTTFYSAYGEGWALYAEQLWKEAGAYADNPMAEIGYLQAALFRAARLVVDTGMHAKRWSREKAIATMVEINGYLEATATTEIERYCVWPGQACSYMVGKLTWLRLREKAKAALGPRFDIRAFHQAGLGIGAAPLTVLESAIDAYIAKA